MPPLQSILIVAAGSAVGGALRAIIVPITPRIAGGFPLGVLLVNVLGSFVFGVAMRMSLQGGLSDQARLLITTGICGGFTTFSAFSWDIVEALEQGRTVMVTTYVVLSLVLGVGAMLLGLSLGRTLAR